MIRFKMIYIRTGNNGWQLMIATRGGKTPRDKVCVFVCVCGGGEGGWYEPDDSNLQYLSVQSEGFLSLTCR